MNRLDAIQARLTDALAELESGCNMLSPERLCNCVWNKVSWAIGCIDELESQPRHPSWPDDIDDEPPMSLAEIRGCLAVIDAELAPGKHEPGCIQYRLSDDTCCNCVRADLDWCVDYIERLLTLFSRNKPMYEEEGGTSHE